jgi:CDP-glycerol glycerophosphotransferase
VVDLSWSGFEAVLDPRALRSARRFTEGTWELFVTVRAAGVKRRRSRFSIEAGRALRAVALPLPGERELTAGLTPQAGVTLEIQPRRAALRDWRVAGDVVELTGELRSAGGTGTALELRRREDARRLRFPLTTNGASPRVFTSEVPVKRLRTAPAGTHDEEVEAGPVAWELATVEGGRRTGIALADGLPTTPGRSAATMVALTPGPGGAELVLREPAPVVRSAEWGPDGTLELRGDGAEGEEAEALEIVLASAGRGEQHAFVPRLGSGGAFAATLTPARIPTLAGELPLPEGRWELRARTRANPGGALMAVAPELEARLGLATVVDHKPFSLEQAGDGRAVLVVRRDLDEDERGAYHQRRLRRTVYSPAATAPLRDAVVYSSFLGRQYSDSPRAIHEELVRRDAPVEHLWVVRDGRCSVPASATVLREGSREYHEAIGRARFVVSNDHFPDWFTRRPEQLCLQTWHGTPLKRLGFDVSDLRKTVRRFERRWREQVGNWQYVLSPNRFTTPILRRAYAIEGEMLETGYPRNDVLARPEREAAASRLRSRLGIPADARVVLYAPTYRDQVVDSRGRFRLDLQLDLERLREGVGHDTVVLFRKHHYIHDAVPATSDGFVRDVSTYPDATELMLVADVLLTDYSSMMFDFANTGRPMLFFTYDLEAYQERIRGFYFDFEATAPGPLLGSTDQVAAALEDLDAVRAQYEERYRAFSSRFCEFDDGEAAARVVDRVFAPAL